MTKAEEEQQRGELYKLSIDELRRNYDNVSQAHIRTRTKIITLIGGGLATLAFLFSSPQVYSSAGEHIKQPIQTVLFFPPEPYGMVFYAMGLILCLTAMTLLFIANQPSKWTMPTEMDDHVALKFPTPNDFLLYVKDEYVNSLTKNLACHEKSSTYLNVASFMFVVGAIVLLIIKTLQ